jgi:hypothetical protein
MRLQRIVQILFTKTLFLRCFGLCSAIIRENIHLQRWELLLDLHLYYSSVNSEIVYAFLGDSLCLARSCNWFSVSARKC